MVHFYKKMSSHVQCLELMTYSLTSLNGLTSLKGLNSLNGLNSLTASTASMVSTASTASRLFLNVSRGAICTERKAEYFSNKKSPKIEKFGRTETFLFGLLQSLSNKLRPALVSHIRDRSVCITIIIETR